jgi:hypothetical protein
MLQNLNFIYIPTLWKKIYLYLTKYVQNVHKESYKSLMKETKDPHKWEDILGPPSIIKVCLYLICRFKVISIEISESL